MTTPDCSQRFLPFREKMTAAGLDAAAVRAFAGSYAALESGATGMISESEIDPAQGLPSAASLGVSPRAGLLEETVVIKLNGGLGTSMGLEKAKSLLPVKGSDSFLDLIARQVTHLRGGKSSPRFLLMNSFSTSDDTQEALRAKHPGLGDPAALELMQNRVPKVREDNLEPLAWPENEDLEWCPPGHGDIYACLLGSGWLDRLLAEGIKYAFVSNSDNLGATLDPELLTWFADSGKSFLMEVTRRTAADRKGGHLAVRKSDGRLLLRESAQCPAADMDSFQNIDRHQYFNTNNLWIRLDRLKEALLQHDGLIPLPVIINKKTADPRNKKSTPVVQLETAMGAAIECFADAGAVDVPRTRFAPVKTTSDLLMIRSDLYRLTEDFRLELDPRLNGMPPHLHLDENRYKLVDGLETGFAEAPSLLGCTSLLVHGPVICQKGVVFKGEVVLHNHSDHAVVLKAGVYEGKIGVA